MSAPVLFNILNWLRKSNKIHVHGKHSIAFRNEFNKFNNTGAQKLDSIYHITLIILNSPYMCMWRANAKIVSLQHDVVMGVVT